MRFSLRSAKDKTSNWSFGSQKLIIDDLEALA